MTGRACTICIHPARAQIDARLLSGHTHAALSKEYQLSDDAIGRHSRRHLSAALASTAEAAQSVETGAGDLLGDMIGLRGRLMRQLSRAEKKQDVRAVVLCAREACRVSELIGRLSGQIAPDGTQVTIRIGDQGAASVRERILGKLVALAGLEPAPAGRIIDADLAE